MSTELLNTLFAGGTFLVIAVTAITAVVQLRHLRTSNQLAALTTLLSDWREPDIQRWFHYVRFELPEKLRDNAYLAAVAESRDRIAHPELQLCDYFEQLASYSKYGFLAEAALIDIAVGPLLTTYIAVLPLVEHLRKTSNDMGLYENFEYVATKCVLWLKAHPHGTYPRNVPRFHDVYP